MSRPNSAHLTNNQYLVQHETFEHQTRGSSLLLDHKDNFAPPYRCVGGRAAEKYHVVGADQ